MLICFIDISGITHFEFVPKRTTVNQTFHVEVFKRLLDAIRHRQELWRGCLMVLHHDNVWAHSLLWVLQFLAGEGVFIMDHPWHSPVLTPADFWLFPKLKVSAKRKAFLRC
jgi:hypothetical protein